MQLLQIVPRLHIDIKYHACLAGSYLALRTLATLIGAGAAGCLRTNNWPPLPAARVDNVVNVPGAAGRVAGLTRSLR